jgi:hypothetical protein
MATGDQPFSVNYTSPTAKAVRSGQPPDLNTLGVNAPIVNPTSIQADFLKSSTNALSRGFFQSSFDPTFVQTQIDQAGVQPNFGSNLDQADPKNPNNISAQNFLNSYQQGVQRGLIAQPVNPQNLTPFMSQPAPYQADDRLVGQAAPFAGSSGTKIG